MTDFLKDFWPLLLAVVNSIVAVVASAHIVVYKRDSRSAIAWVGLVWLTPLVGAVLYVLLGINRIRRRGQKLRSLDNQPELLAPAGAPGPEECRRALVERHPGVAGHIRLARMLTGRPLLGGNRVEPLVGGEEAYPAMLGAIESAERSITLCTYIFDHDRVGREFLEALERATRRGVEVRVLIDAVGARYSRPRMTHLLESGGVPVRSFLPTRVPRLVHYANLRNHRKILVVDGKLGFTGGMNIREGNRLDLDPSHPIRDVHFRLEGPVVADLQATFVMDWQFSAGELLEGETWFPPLEPAGDVWARGIADGPDEDFEKLRLTILGALAAATSTVHVVTPYFLPDNALITALNVAALRGVEVRIVLPERNNLPPVQWASTALLWQLLERGCRIWLSPPPFDHTKLFLVDGGWCLIGSANWDPRSLRLNFELNVECYDFTLADTLTALVESRIALSREITLEDVESRSRLVRVRDGAARLFSPYL